MNSDDQAIALSGQARATGGHEADVRAGLQAFVDPARRESGRLLYEMFEDVRYTGSFYSVEMWGKPKRTGPPCEKSTAGHEQDLPMLTGNLAPAS